MKATAHGGSGSRILLVGAGLGLGAGILGGLGGLVAGLPGAILGSVAAAVALALVLQGFGSKLLSASPEPVAKPAAKAPDQGPAVIPPDRIDSLTGLANANGLSAWFVEKKSRLEEDGRGIVVLVANLDRFDEVQRVRGKQSSDSILIEVAKRVAVFAGEDGIAAHTGGDEFVAVATVVPEKAAEFAEERAGTMAETIGRPVELSSGAIWIGGSVGAAVGRPAEGEGILARAREAFLKARKLGLGRYVVDRSGF